MAGMNIKVSNAWKTVSSAYIKINNVWKNASNVYIKVNGVWKAVLDSIPTYYAADAEWYEYPFPFPGDAWHNNREKYLTLSNDYATITVTASSSLTTVNTGDTFYINFRIPPLEGYGSEKSCYIWCKNSGKNSYFKLENAHTINSGKYKITFDGKVFKVVT